MIKHRVRFPAPKLVHSDRTRARGLLPYWVWNLHAGYACELDKRVSFDQHEKYDAIQKAYD